MNEVITIENTEMQVKEYNGKRVVTFKDIDAVHQRTVGTAKRNFNKNKKHFIDGEDYIKVCVDEIRTNKIMNISNKARNDVVLITESGYLMLAKSFTDDLSWQVQRCLVNNYFNKPFVAQRAISAEQFSVDYPKPIYKTSSTPIPRNTNWYRRNRRRMMLLAEKCNVSVTKVYSQILTTLGEEFDLDTANEIFKQELGHPPVYALDIVSYFTDLAEYATKYLDIVEKRILSEEKEDS